MAKTNQRKQQKQKLLRKQKILRKQQQRVNRIEALPVELQLIILEHLSSVQDLVALIEASPAYCATYLAYKKTVIAHIAQATLGDAFPEACMLQYWQHHVDTGYTHIQEDDESETGNTTNGGSQWPSGPYRHIQLRFIHMLRELAMTEPGEQVHIMKRSFNLADFGKILSFNNDVIKPLSNLFARPKSVSAQEIIHRLGQWDPDVTPEAGHVTETEQQRIMRTLYRYQICCRLYGPKPDQETDGIVDLGDAHRLAMANDFFHRYDRLENEEIDFVYSGLAFELQRAFIRIRNLGHGQWWLILLLRAAAQGRRTPWQMHYHYHQHTPIGLGGVTAGALSRGLELVEEVRSALRNSADEVEKVMVRSNPPELDNFVWDALSKMRESFHYREEFPESWTDEFWR